MDARSSLQIVPDGGSARPSAAVERLDSHVNASFIAGHTARVRYTDLLEDAGRDLAPGASPGNAALELAGATATRTQLLAADRKKIPDSHRYRMCGNGVIATVAEYRGECSRTT